MKNNEKLLSNEIPLIFPVHMTRHWSEVVGDWSVVTVPLNIIGDGLGTTDGVGSEVVGDWSVVTVPLDIVEDELWTNDGTEDEVVEVIIIFYFLLECRERWIC